MADVKISALPASTTPLAGTEVLPIVQGTTTKQVSVANLTAGRAVSAASLSTTGDITSSGYLRFNTYGSNVNDFAAYITAAGGTTLASQSVITLRTADVTRLSIGATGGVSIGNTTDPGAGILSVSSGVKFPATQVPSADPNTLDDYEEGTWTPTQGAGLTVIGTFSSSGTYTKIGRQVTVFGFLVGSTSLAASVGTLICGGLPFSPSNEFDGASHTSAYNAGYIVGVSGTNVWVWSSAIPPVAQIKFTITYFV
jgi:hypothetical protein